MKIFGLEISRTKPQNREYDPLRGYVNWGPTVAGVNVNEASALSLSAYWAGVRIISESLAMLPVDVIKKQGNRREQVDHPSEYLLNAEANYKATAFDFTQILVTSAINHGNGLAIIERDKYANPISLINVHPDDCKYVEFDEEVYWLIKIGDKKEQLKVMDRDMLNLRGFGTDAVEGLSAIKAHKQNIGLALATQKYGADFYNKGTFIDGYIEFPGKLDRDTKDAISEQWTRNYGSTGTKGTALLDQGSKYHRLGMPPADAEFIATRKFQKNEIATILGVPPHMINELERSTFSNIEHQGIEFVTYCLGTWIEKLEQEYRRKLLKESEKKTHVFKFNVNRLLRTDAKTQGEYFRLLSDLGVLSINEIRTLLDQNPVENGDGRYVQLNRIPLEQMADYYKKDPNQTPPTRSVKRGALKSVSFDFDGTLSREDVQEYAKTLNANKYIITSRPTKSIDNSDLIEVAKSLGISDENIIFTSYEPKMDRLVDMDVLWHLENDKTEIREINENTSTLAINVEDDDWQQQCNKLLK